MDTDRGHADQYVSVADIASSCGASKMTIYRLVQSGRLPAHRRHRTLLIKVADAENALQIRIDRLPTSSAADHNTTRRQRPIPPASTTA